MTNEEAIEILSGKREYGSTEPERRVVEWDMAIALAIKALSEQKITIFTENQTIRWTDKVSLKDNGDIVDFEGRVIGHINFDEG